MCEMELICVVCKDVAIVVWKGYSLCEKHFETRYTEIELIEELYEDFKTEY